MKRRETLSTRSYKLAICVVLLVLVVASMLVWHYSSRFVGSISAWDSSKLGGREVSNVRGPFGNASDWKAWVASLLQIRPEAIVEVTEVTLFGRRDPSLRVTLQMNADADVFDARTMKQVSTSDAWEWLPLSVRSQQSIARLETTTSWIDESRGILVFVSKNGKDRQVILIGDTLRGFQIPGFVWESLDGR